MLDLNQTPAEEMQGAASERYSRSTNQPDAEYIWTNLSEQQKLVASNSFNVYCRPVQIYNKIQSRPRFLQRCLYHNRKAKHKKRILMTVLLSWKVEEIQSLFPMCICLGRLLDPKEEPTGEESYHVRRISTFEGPTGIDWDGINHVRISFMLPHIEKLAVETNCDKYFLFILTSAENPISLSTVNARTLTSEEVASNESSGGEKCVYGKVSLKFLYEILNISPDSPLQYRTEIQFSTQLRSCNLKYWLKHYTRTTSSTISIRDSNDSEGISKKLEISTSFEEFGAASGRTQERKEEPSSSLLPHFTWSPGIVSFYYRYYHNMLHRLEVTENFTCAICLVQCINYKSLKFHLKWSHQIFRFGFSESEEFPSVSVSVKNENWLREFIDPKVDTFMYCVKKPKSRKMKTSSHGRNDTDPLLDVELRIGIANARLQENMVQQDQPDEVTTLEVEQEQVSNAVSDPSQGCVSSVSDHDETRGVQEVDHEEISNAIVVYTVSEHDAVPQDAVPQDAVQQDAVPQDAVPQDAEQQDAVQQDAVQQDAVQQDAVQQDAVQQDEVSNAIMLHPSPDFVPFVPMNEGTSSVTQAEEKEKLLSERCDPNMLARWKKRTFYHSHTYQAMDLEEVVKDEDSEDEINEGARVIEDRRKLELLGLSEDQKRLVTMWTSFVKKHRVLVDGHMNWAYEAFTRYHCAELVHSTPLAWAWRLFMIKLYDLGLLKPKTVAACAAILQQYREQK
ncbi:polycomb group protein EMBRYONIC FLOWER 2-like isoform X2 [Vigna angularis]|uniref:polycomb group protein EMBRYONIC FLOWER 2-like isoform X2 n=1 Tax=Phaseolus angularis TaxID=3914 RepID=UPI0022B4FD80|nr:polycomb group protein EMBRYONIC FLOWER 2-like isoform X2 [Vigna angularis]